MIFNKESNCAEAVACFRAMYQQLELCFATTKGTLSQLLSFCKWGQKWCKDFYGTFTYIINRQVDEIVPKKERSWLLHKINGAVTSQNSYCVYVDMKGDINL